MINHTIMQLRCICTSIRLQASAGQTGRFVNKIMSSDITKKSKRKNPIPHSSMPEPFTSSISKKAKVTTHATRRVTVLNKIFMKHITDLMATGEVAPSLVGRGIEISSVKVAPDFGVVNVFWYAQNEADTNESVEMVLKKSAGQLQHELSQLRVIGIVPPIRFVRNRRYGVIKEVEDRLSKVDFGEDYIPTTYIKRNFVPTLETTLSPKVKAQLAELNIKNEDNKEESEEDYELHLPEMRQDILGFDHFKVMQKIKASLNRSKTAEKNRILNIVPPESIESQITSSDIADFLSKKDENKLFDDFLKQRSIDERRRRRAGPLRERQLEDETDWMEKMNDNDIEDINIDDYRDEYEDIESYK